MKYNEDKFLEEFNEYLSSTYSSHYSNDTDDIQVQDLLHSLGLMESFSKSSIIKYASRYGKKDGYNKKDLFKIVHYVLLLSYCTLDKEKI